LIHNDYKFDNVVFDPEAPARVLAVLDWEMATRGDPLLDLGTTLAYWADRDDPEEWRRASVVPATLDAGCLSRAEAAARYARASGRELPEPALLFAFACGLFKLAVIAQQIYARFRAGHTRDPRFAGLIQVVRGCGRMGLRAVETGRIERLG
jgi:aminoglycoside phosphotransferase (APT) family kinase protein